jgi:hypothetical protein
MSFEERFRRNNIQFSEENGSEIQQLDMSVLIALRSRAFGQLDDYFKGISWPKDHPHHKIPDLVNGIIVNTKAVLELRKEIQNTK